MTSECLKNMIVYSKRLTLLYVEDDEKIATAALSVFKKFFDKIIYAKDGQDGIVKFNENHIDLIFTDINMPNLNGLEMLEKINHLDKNVPAVIMSAHNELDFYKIALDLNVAGYILKPTKISDIVEKLEKIVSIKKNEDLKTNKFNSLVESNKKLIDIGYQISTQKDHQKLLEIILLGAKDLSNADGGTLYLYNKKDDCLDFKIVINDKLNLHYGGSKGKIDWDSLDIYNSDKTINQKNVAVVCAMNDKLVNINDIYHSASFDFSGAKKFDSANEYKTTSMLVIPMRNRENELVGVIQLINKLDEDKNIISFNKSDESLITSMSSQASMMLENNKLVDDLEALLCSLIKSIGSALSAKSSYTAKHIDNVAKIAEIIALGVNNNKTTFNDVSFNSNELEEIKLAALLH
ncbi:MAG: response regulator [Campylobacterota bacterium]|nr:response regulator [Campylobacterota bacterium]